MKSFKLKVGLFSIIMLMMMGVFSIIGYAKGWATDGSDWFYYDQENQLVKETIKASGDDKYYLDQNGFMVRDYLLEDYNNAVYYFDESGKMVRNTWVAVDTTQVENAMDNPPSIYLYYFGASGKAFKGRDDIPAKKTIDGKKYLFNSNGQMLSGWINEQGERYDYFNDTDDDPFEGYCYFAGDETDGVLREGWSSYEDGSVDDKYYQKGVLWFYFVPGNCKKEHSNDERDYKVRVINGKKYGFDYNGVMIKGWESDTIEDYGNTNTYFSENENDENERGRMYKKEWIFAVPSKEMCEIDATDAEGNEKLISNDHDEEIQRWFYALGDGSIVKNSMKKINGKYYAFNKVGIMKHGLCIVDRNKNTFIDCIDIEKTEGKDFIMSRQYISLDAYNGSEVYRLFDDKTQKIFYFNVDEAAPDYGERKTGNVTIAFADNDYTFASSNQGQNEGVKKKKYYQAGLLLKAEPTVGYGLVLAGYASNSNATGVGYAPKYHGSTALVAHEDRAHRDAFGNYQKTDYIVDINPSFCSSVNLYPVFYAVNTAGKKIEKTNTAVKDKAGHYWLFGAGNALVKIFDVPIKYSKSKNIWYFKSEMNVGDSVKTGWIAFADSPGVATASPSVVTKDVYGKECYLAKDKPLDKTTTYESYLDDNFSINFRFTDN